MLNDDLWDLYEQISKHKQSLISSLETYNKKWDLDKKSVLLEKDPKTKLKSRLYNQRRDLLITFLKFDRWKNYLEEIEDQILSRLNILNSEILIIKSLIDKFKGLSSLNDNNIKTIRLAENLLKLKKRELQLHNLLISELSKFNYLTAFDVEEILKNEMLIVGEEERKLFEGFPLGPEAFNRSKLIISIQKLRTLHRNHLVLKNTFKEELVLRDKSVVALSQLFYLYNKREPVARAILDSLNNNNLDEEKYLSKRIKFLI